MAIGLQRLTSRCLALMLPLLLGWVLLLAGCEPSGDSDILSTPTTPGPRVEQQAVDNLLQLYGQALQHEDIDRLQALLQPEPNAAATDPRATHGTLPELAAFRQSLSTTFRGQTVTDHAILPHTIQVVPDRTQVTFIEVESVADPRFLDHRSRVYHTTFTLQRTATSEAVRFRIQGVQRDGPLVAIHTQGQMQADVRSRVEVTALPARFALGRVEIVEPTFQQNSDSGILVVANATATISRNVSQHNTGAGIVVFGNSTATIIQNTSSFNTDGIIVDSESTADIRNNTTTDTIQPSDLDGYGIIIAGGSEATINGGLSTRNQGHGIYVFVSPFTSEPMPGTARIGLDRTTVLEITDNGGAGLFVADDGSSAEIDSRNLVFRNNAEGDIVGNVTDVAP